MNDGGEIWGVEIEGKRGFVNRRHIQETRIFKSQLGHRITEGNGSNSENNEPVNYVLDKSHDQASNSDNIKENRVSESGEKESIISEDNNNPALQAKDQESNRIEGSDGTVKGQ